MKVAIFLAALSALAVALPSEVVNGMTLVPTPHGWRPKQCVFQMPSGTAIKEIHGENRTEVTMPSGEVVHLPRLEECMRWDYNVPHVPSSFTDRESVEGGAGKVRSVPDGWLDNAFYWTNRHGDSKSYLYSFEGYYTVPNTPKTPGGLLYYFLGAENMDYSGNLGLTILQPVLTYSDRWYMASWNCCPNGQSIESSEINGFGPGEKVYGSMHEIGAELSGNWDIVSTYGKESATLEVADHNRTFDYIDATLETYYVGDDCTKLASGPMTYTQMALVLQNEMGEHNPTTIRWSVEAPSACDGTTTVNSPTSITIQHEF